MYHHLVHCLDVYLYIYWKSEISGILVLILLVLQCTDYELNFLTLLTLILTTQRPCLRNEDPFNLLREKTLINHVAVLSWILVVVHMTCYDPVFYVQFTILSVILLIMNAL